MTKLLTISARLIGIKKGKAFTLGEATYRLLQENYFENYCRFVTAAHEPKQDTRNYLSLEGIHNNIHNWTGGDYGHMGNVPIAAFDPIFWLHHTNIDRLLAMWQTLYPNEWWQSDTIHDKDGKPVGTFKPTDPPEPFHRDTIATTHDSNGVLQRWNYPSEEEFIESVKKAVHDLYAPDSELCLITAYHDFLVNVEFERFALEGAPFTVKILLNGETIGSIYNFSAATYGGCVNCAVQQKVNVLTTGQVSLTSAHRELVQDEKITELTDYGIENVSNYLKQNLKWKSSRWRGCALWDGFAQEAQANSY